MTDHCPHCGAPLDPDQDAELRLELDSLLTWCREHGREIRGAQRPLVRIQSAADYAGLSLKTVRNRCADPDSELRSARVGSLVFVPAQDFVADLAKRRRNVPAGSRDPLSAAPGVGQ